MFFGRPDSLKAPDRPESSPMAIAFRQVLPRSARAWLIARSRTRGSNARVVPRHFIVVVVMASAYRLSGEPGHRLYEIATCEAALASLRDFSGAVKPLVLIVDDEFELAELSGDVLVEEGFETAIAVNGRLALDFLGTRDVALVITDLMMPVMDGAAMIRRMRDDPRFANIPVILVTAQPEGVLGDARFLHDALLAKPFGRRELVELAHRLTRDHA
jgi:CheY-like chemotaxis protein